MKCYICPQVATKDIRGVKMCLDCYVIALEHCADFCSEHMNHNIQLPGNAVEVLKKIKQEKEASRIPGHRVEKVRFQDR